MNFRTVILAAGKGKRMGQSFPKALTPIGGKPILEYLVSSIKESGVDDFPLIVTGPEGQHLCEEFDQDCEYVSQLEQLGTGHAVMIAREKVSDADAVIVLYGDHPFISAQSLQRLTDRHKDRDNVITMMTTTVPSFDDWYCAFSRWGRIIRGEDGHISGIQEYKDATEEEREIKEVNPALFCFDAYWLWENISNLTSENAQGEYYLTDLIHMAVEQGQPISSLDIKPEEAIGINTPDDCKVAEEVYLKTQKQA